MPTLLLAIGYPIYWIELYCLDSRRGITSPLAAGLFLFFAIFILVRERQSIAAAVGESRRWFLKSDKFTQISCAIALLLIALIGACAMYASFLPPHLMQESDAMNYHYSLTRQHLILKSFERIPWSGFDLFFLPVDFALAPYWFATPLPNKIPQFIFFIGLILVLVNLTRFFKKDAWCSAVVAVAFLFGSHGHGIQMGSAMLDLVNTYLFLAAIDSFFKRAHWLFIIEANFYLWSKSFAPIQTLAVIIAVAATILILKRLGFKEILLDFQKVWINEQIKVSGRFLRQCAVGFCAMSVLVAGPFIVKSLSYSGTPLYPFATGVFSHPQAPEGSVAWESIKAVANYSVYSVRDNYGYGRSFSDLLKHFWLIAVPDKGVNNLFDYPLGLTYLLVLGPFVFFTVEALRQRRIPVLALFTIIFWGSWWFSSQQSRWLYVPLCLMFVTVAVRLEKPSKILWISVIAALVFNGLSIIRAHKADFGRSPMTVLRLSDRQHVELSAAYIRDQRSDIVELEEAEVAFAQFPVVVRKENLPNAVAF